MRRTYPWSSLLVGLALSLLGCSDDEGGGGQSSRAKVLDQLADQIAADGLSDRPSQTFVTARGQIERGVDKPETEYARRYTLAGGGSKITTDSTFARVRGAAAKALGTTLDPAREADAASAQRGLDALLLEVKKRVPTAQSCEDLGDRAVDCVIALLIIEVQRSEAPPVADAGVPDAGTDAGADGGLPSTITPIECGARDLVGAREITVSTISAPETWSGKVLVKRQLLVQSTLSIMPGTEIFMDSDSSLEVGWNNAAAAIIADGTAAAPIRICGTVAEKGYWRALTVGSNVTSNSVLRNVLVADGGGDDGAALQLDADLTVDNVQVRNAEFDGVTARDFAPNSRLLSVIGAGRAAVVLEAGAAVERFPRGGAFQGNVDNTVHLRFSNIDATTRFANLGIPYLQEQDLLQRGGDFIVEAGVEYRLQAASSLEFGWNNAGATVHLNGTPTAPVRFRAAADAGQWVGITVGSNVTTDSVFSNVEITQAGAGTPALDIAAPIKLDGVTLTKNTTGMELSAAGLAAGSKNLTITQTAGRPLSAAIDAVFTLPSGGSFAGNTKDEIELTGTNLRNSGTIPDLGVPYFIAGDVLVIGGSNVVVAPGVDFSMGVDSSIEVAWNNGMAGFVAEGTADAPIRFLGADPTPGSWAGLIIGETVLSSARLSYVEIGHAGGPRTSPGNALDLQRAIPVTNCRFFQSAGYGLKPPARDTTDYTLNNRFEQNALGNVRPAT